MACYVLFLLYGIVTICASFKLRKTSFIHGRYHAVRHIRCTSEEVDITQATAVESNPIILPILQKSKRGKRKPTWEDKFENDPLKSDYPTEDLHHPVDPFTKWWVCFASIESSQRRQEAWIQHIQWARRSILAQSLISDSVKATSESKFDVVPAVKVEHAYTLLHDDCMSPKSQVLIMRANHSSFVHDFIRSEPLASHQAVRPWQVFELRSEEHSVHKDEEDDWKDFLCGDVSDPYMFLAINSKSADRRSTGPQLREGTLDKSLGYHLQCAGAPYVPPQLLLETSTIRTGTTVESKVVRTAVGTPPRVVMLGRLHHTAADFDVQSVSEIPQSQSAPAGQLLLFNAKTRAEAMRYLSMDPVARSAQNSAGMPELFDTMVRLILLFFYKHT